MRKLLIAAGVACGMAIAAQAAVIDITTHTPGNNNINGALFFFDDPQPTGTGVIDPFLREQISDSKSSFERGINTSIKKPGLDDKPGPWTHDLLLSQLSIVSFNGANYFEFLLDANQVANKPISLTGLKLFLTGASPVTSKDGLQDVLNSTPVYTMGTGNEVQISSQHGSGSGDMFVLIPTPSTLPDGAVYLWAQFGGDNARYKPNDGFEEWYTKTGAGQQVPDTATTMMLLGMGLLGVETLRRKLC